MSRVLPRSPAGRRPSHAHTRPRETGERRSPGGRTNVLTFVAPSAYYTVRACTNNSEGL